MADDIDIRVKVDAQGAITQIDKTGKEIADLGNASERASKSFSAFGSILQGVGQSIGAALLPKLAQLPSLIVDLASKGSEIDDMGAAFQRLAQQAGATSDVLLGELKDATAGTISDFELMQRSNEALNAGLKPDNLITVANAARAMGETFGGDLKNNFDALLDSLQKGDDRYLKSKGILIDNQKAYEAYAKSLGVATDALSEIGKAEAIQAAAIEEMKRQFTNAGEITLDTGDAISKLKAQFDNAVNAIRVAIGTNEELKNALLQLGDALANINVEEVASAIGSGLTTAINTATEAVKVFNNEWQNLARGWEVVKARSIDLGNANYEQARKTQESAVQNKKLSDSLASLSKIQDEAWKLQYKMADGLKVTKDELRPLEQEFKAVSAVQLDAALKQGAYSERLKETSTILKTLGILLPQAKKNQENHTNAINNATKAHKTLVEINKDYESKIRDTIDQLAKGILTNAEAAKSIDDLGQAYKKSGGEAESFAKIHDLVVTKALEDTAKKAEELKKQTEESASEGIFGIKQLSTGDKGIDQAVGDFGQQFVDAMADGLNRADVKPLSEAVVQLVAQASGLPPEVAQILGKTLGGAIGRVLEKLGDDTEGTKARKAVDKYFADLFKGDRLGIIVGDELKRLSDLAFRGDTLFGGNADFGKGTFDDFFKSLNEQTQQAFSGVGAAFEQMLGKAGDISGQVAAVFANNIGGSINNLQLLVQATGVSFEDLHTQIVNAFLDGKLSVEEAQNSLNGLAQVAQSGIPDGIGLIDQAFKNLQAAGTKGGRALVDALQDIGFEAIELGQKDFATLEAELKTRLPSASEAIDQLFSTLESSGIKSIDQLTKATADQLLPALAELSRQKFPFEEQSKNVNDLIQKMENFPEEVNSRINIEVNTKYTGDTQSYVNSGGTIPAIGDNRGR